MSRRKNTVDFTKVELQNYDLGAGELSWEDAVQYFSGQALRNFSLLEPSE